MDQSHTLCFILGRVPELSGAEALSVLSARGLTPTIRSFTRDALSVSVTQPVDCVALMRELGGCIKIGTLSDTSLSGHIHDVHAETLADGVEMRITDSSKRVTIGISSYTVSQKSLREHRASRRVRQLGLAVKKVLKSRGYSVRVVAPQLGDTLTSVQVEKNHLTRENGVELLLLAEGDVTRVALTDAVQAFEEYSLRDYSRPERSMDVGLLPPKLARMMVNLAGVKKDGTLLDPFCGFGTIIQEALMVGYSSLVGCDINESTLAAAKKNLAWLSNEKGASLAAVRLISCDARKLSSTFPANSVDAIVTEPYLGPSVHRSGVKNLSAILRELEQLYTAFFHEAHRTLKGGAPLVIVLPFWIEERKKTRIPFLPKLLGLGFVSALNTKDLPDFGNLSDRGSIFVSRPGQHVGRELFVLKKTT